MISIVIPVFNERENVHELLAHLREVVESSGLEAEFIFINDGSGDGSSEVLDELAAQDERVVVVHLRTNAGQTAAMMAGFDEATGDIIVCLDADLQNDPEDIPCLLAKLDEGYDVVSGWRHQRKDSFLSRVFVSRIANRLISVISGVRIHDYGCSLKAYRSEILQGVRLYGEMHRFIPIYAAWHGARIAEIKVKHHRRKRGKSNYGLGRVFKVCLDLIVVKFLYGFHQKPMYVFGGVALGNFILAFLAGCLALYYKFTGQKSFVQTPLPLLVALTFLTGSMCILMGLLAELIIRTYYEAQHKKTYLLARIVRSNRPAPKAAETKV